MNFNYKKIQKKNSPVRRPSEIVHAETSQAFSYYRSSRAPEPRFDSGRGGSIWKLKTNLKGLRIVPRIPEIIALIVITASILHLMLLSSSVRIVKYGDVELTQYRDPALYTSIAEKVLGSSMRGSTKLLVQPEKIKSKLMETFPEIEAVDVSIPAFGNKAVLYITLLKPLAVVKEGSDNYFLGTNGIILPLPPGADTSTFIQISDASGLPIKVGSAVLSATQTDTLKRIHDQLVAVNLRPKSYTLPSAPYEVDAVLENRPFLIKFSLQSDPDVQVGVLNSAINQIDSAKPQEYVDVRVEDKLFYR